MRPVEPGAGQQAHSAAIEPRMHAIAVELDFVEPLRAVRRFLDELRQLRPDPLRQTASIGARPARYMMRHGGSGEIIRPRDYAATGPIKLGSLFLTLPTRWLTGQQIISAEEQGTSRDLSCGRLAGSSPSHERDRNRDP